jgi:hypothetical protein
MADWLWHRCVQCMKVQGAGISIRLAEVSVCVSVFWGGGVPLSVMDMDMECSC